MTINIKYSYKSLKRKTFLDIPSEEFNDSEIVGSSFYQDEPYTSIFRPDINTVFVRCNLDNCIIPDNAIVIGGTNKQIKCQNDCEYWIVDKSLNPIEPRDKENFINLGLSVDPNDIPETHLNEPITITNNPKKIEYDIINKFINDYEKVRKAALAIEKVEA